MELRSSIQLPSRYKLFKTGTYSFTEETHTPQCNCNTENSNFLSRNYKALFNFLPTDCWRCKTWQVKSKNPGCGVLIYNELLNACFENSYYTESVQQIELDLGRTFPGIKHFRKGSPGREALRRVLTAFSKYDPQLGYVQGMNFIAGALLWHSSEVEAFWFLVGLMEDFELRDNFLPNMPGLNKHAQIIELLIFEKLPELHRKFADIGVSADIIITDWCFTLFANVVKVNDMGCVLSGFFEGGWVFFYKLVLVILYKLQPLLLSCGECWDVLTLLKSSQNLTRALARKLGTGFWSSLVKEALNLSLDEKYIKYLHMNFSTETALFKIT